MTNDIDEVSKPLTVTIIPGESNRLERALSNFVDRVREASAVYDADRHLNDGRQGCKVALTAAIDLCGALGLTATDDRTFFRLLLALQNADSGADDALIARAKLGRKGPVSIIDLRQRGYVAAALQALTDDGMNLAEAAKWIVPKVRGMSAAQGIRRDLGKAIKGWRDEASAGEYKVDWNTTTYRDACEAMRSFGIKGKAAAHKLLTDAAEIG